MRIETERLVIRSLELEDENAYIEMATDGSLSEIFGDCSECSDWMEDWIEEARRLDRKNNPQKDYLAYAIVDKESGVPVGSVGCSYYKDLKLVGITYFIGTKYRRKGFAAEAARAYAEYFLEHYDIPEIIATVKNENEASCKTIEKAGFTLMDSIMYKDINDSEEELYNFYTLNTGTYLLKSK